MAAAVEYTIDELAREAGTTVRSLRVYHERGVLPPPQVKGRTGFYGPEHLNRVRTISRLLDRGIKLNGIRELLDAWDRGDDLGDILGVIEPDAAKTEVAEELPEVGETIAATELAERYHEVPNGLARVVTAGLYEPVDAENYRLADRRLVRIVEKLSVAGVPAAEVLDELEAAGRYRPYRPTFRRPVPSHDLCEVPAVRKGFGRPGRARRTPCRDQEHVRRGDRGARDSVRSTASRPGRRNLRGAVAGLTGRKCPFDVHYSHV